MMPITSNLFGIEVNSRFGNKRCLMVLTQRLCYNKQKVLTIREHMNSLQCFDGFCVVYIFILFCLSLFCALYPLLPVSLDCSFLIIPSVHSNVYLAICVFNATFQQYFSNIFCVGPVVLVKKSIVPIESCLLYSKIIITWRCFSNNNKSYTFFRNYKGLQKEPNQNRQ